MRAAEIGVRALGRSLDVSSPDKPLELADWHQILEQTEAKIKLISDRPKSAERDANQQFYSTSASQFRYFKDWRNRVAHARTSFDEIQATKILDHTRDFFDSLAERLSER